MFHLSRQPGSKTNLKFFQIHNEFVECTVCCLTKSNKDVKKTAHTAIILSFLVQLCF